jgi:lysozyme
MSKGIDVSNNNGHVDWAQVAAEGYTYAFAKATEGLGFVDSFYPANRAGAAAHGIKFGAYHFFTPGEDPAEQVSFFLSHAKPRTGDIVPALDYERPPSDKAPAEAFVVALKRELGVWPFFYTFLSFVEQMHIPVGSPLASCPLWLADFTTARPAPPKPWHEITIWQHSSTAKVPGIGGSVDVDAGTPVVIPAAKPIGWDVTYRTKDGAKHKVRIKRPKHGPTRWLMNHPKAKENGRIIFDPIHKK